jgi:hypothetical protein
MATPAEHKALLFLAVVATLGAGVRLWRAPHTHPIHQSSATSRDADRRGGRDSRDEPDVARSHARKRTPGRTSTTRTGARKSRAAGSRIGHIDRDSTSIIDLDRATVAEIDALGVVPAGTGRMIVDDRAAFGPFGSIDELRRVPYLSSAIIRKLAPRVTFSLLARPKNTVIQLRSRAVIVKPRTKHLGNRSTDP